MWTLLNSLTVGSNGQILKKTSHLAVRCLAYGNNWKNKPKKRKQQRQKKSAKGKQTELPEASSLLGNEKIKAPNLLLPTASPHVFISKTAIADGVDHNQLFQETVAANYNIPPLFQNSKFEYFVGSNFNHKLPEHGLAEVAFLGRSNVGKSSLINALTNSNMARISKQPGRTQQAHFFGLVPKTVLDQDRFSLSSALGFLVDLPGYGFAVGPDKQVDRWQRQTQTFLLRRRDNGSLKRLFLLMDSRRGITVLDATVATWLDEAEIPHSIVWTKMDQVGPAQLIKSVNEACMRFSANQSQQGQSLSPIVHVSSSKQGRGVAELLSSVEAEFALQEN